MTDKLLEEAGDRMLCVNKLYIKFKFLKRKICECSLPTNFIFADEDCECGLNYKHIHHVDCMRVIKEE